MSEIIIKDGHLYKDGVKLELEFGNLEHIKAVRNYEKRMEAFGEDGLELEPTYKVEITAMSCFNCVCETPIYFECPANSTNDIECFDGSEEKCHVCNQTYLFQINDYNKLSVVFKKRNS